jgi:hypothetical protein
MLDRVREKLRAAVDNPSAKLGVGKWARAMTYLSTTDQVGQMALRTETSDEGKSAIRKLVDRIQRLTPVRRQAP